MPRGALSAPGSTSSHVGKPHPCQACPLRWHPGRPGHCYPKLFKASSRKDLDGHHQPGGVPDPPPVQDSSPAPSSSFALGLPAAMLLTGAGSQVQQKLAVTGSTEQPLCTPLWAGVLRAPRGPWRPPHADVMLCDGALVLACFLGTCQHTHLQPAIPPTRGHRRRLCCSQRTFCVWEGGNFHL